MTNMRYTKSSLKRYDQLCAEQQQYHIAAKAAWENNDLQEWRKNKIRAKALNKLINFYYLRAMYYGFQRK